MLKRKPAPPRLDTNEAPVIVAEGFELGGRLSLTRPAILNGRIYGDVVSTSSIVIGAKGLVHAAVKADRVTVRGEVVGNVTALDRIDVEPGARVRGDLEAPEVTIAPGVLFEGACRMTPNPAFEPALHISEAADVLELRRA